MFFGPTDLINGSFHPLLFGPFHFCFEPPLRRSPIRSTSKTKASRSVVAVALFCLGVEITFYAPRPRSDILLLPSKIKRPLTGLSFFKVSYPSDPSIPCVCSSHSHGHLSVRLFKLLLAPVFCPADCITPFG